MDDRERLAARRWLTRVSTEMEAAPWEPEECEDEGRRGCAESPERLRDAADEATLRRDDGAGEAAMMTVGSDDDAAALVIDEWLLGG